MDALMGGLNHENGPRYRVRQDSLHPGHRLSILRLQAEDIIFAFAEYALVTLFIVNPIIVFGVPLPLWE
jgi:hypothetical protein